MDHLVIEKETVSDQDVETYADWVSEAFGRNHDVVMTACWGPYEEHPKRWKDSWAYIISESRAEGRFFTDAEGNALMICFEPGKTLRAKMQSPKTRASGDAQRVAFVDREMGEQRAALTEKLFPGGAHMATFKVDNLAVKRGHQGKGLAKAMLDTARAISKELGVPCTLQAPMPKCELYQKYGFELVGSGLIKHYIPERSWSENMMAWTPDGSSLKVAV